MKWTIKLVSMLMALLLLMVSCAAPEAPDQPEQPGNKAPDMVSVTFQNLEAKTTTVSSGTVDSVAIASVYFQYKAVNVEGLKQGEVTEWTDLSARPGLSTVIKLGRGIWHMYLRGFATAEARTTAGTAETADTTAIFAGEIETFSAGNGSSALTANADVPLEFTNAIGKGSCEIEVTFDEAYASVEGKKVSVRIVCGTTDKTNTLTFGENGTAASDTAVFENVDNGIATITVDYLDADGTPFGDSGTATTLIMTDMTTKTSATISMDVVKLTVVGSKPLGSAEDYFIPKVFNSIFDIYPDNIADNAIVVGYAEETKALDQTPITYPYEIYTSAEKDAQGRYTASSLGLVPITVTGRTQLNSSGATEAWYGKGISHFSSSYEPTNTVLEKVKFVDGVTSIGNSVFYNCKSLTSVTIPDGVTSIGSYVFKNCSGLTSINIPDSVTSIGNDAFRGCSGLTSVTIPDSVTSVGQYAFYDCTGLTSVTLGNGVTSIGNSVFYNCKSLTSVTIPDNVESIGKQAFFGCTGLTSVTLGNGVTSIGESAFSGCNGLTSITIPNNVTSLGKGWCGGLKSITVRYEGTVEQWYNLKGGAPSYYDGSYTHYGDVECSDGKSVFVIVPNDAGNGKLVSLTKYGKTLSAITIPSGYEIIEKPDSEFGNRYGLFYDGCGAPKMVSVELPSDIERIYKYMFTGCSSLESITIPYGVTSIGSYAFQSCRSLTSIIIPDSITSIKSSAFEGSGLTSIVIPEGLTSLGINAFKGTHISDINLPSTIELIEDGCFAGCEHNSYYSAYDSVVYNGTLENWMNVQECSLSNKNAMGLFNAGINSSSDIQCSDGKAIFITNKNNSSIVGIRPYGKTLTTLEVPENYTSISCLYDSSYGTPSVTTLILHSSIETLSDNVFKYCTRLTDVYIDKAEDSIDFSNTGLPASCTIHWNSTGPESV